MNERLLAISDIHGCYETFVSLLNKIGFNKSDKLVIIGDLIDKGTGSKQLIDEIIKLQEDGFHILVTMGNHEDLMLESINSQHKKDTWRFKGGAETLKSFNVSAYDELENKYKIFFESLPLFVGVGKYIFIHGGVDTTNENPFHKKAALWSRTWRKTLNREWLGDRYIIAGHTPQPEHLIASQFSIFEEDRTLIIDGGCSGFNLRPELGKLCAVDLTNKKLYFEHFKAKDINPIDKKNSLRINRNQL
jgi:serine/threonine protein phosphatase 1